MPGKTLRELTIELDATTIELRRELGKAQKQLKGFQKRIDGIGKRFKQAFSIAAVGIAAKKIVDLGMEMSTLGKELEGVQAGFKGIDPKILDEMRAATHGTVTELELMKAAVQAKNFGLPVEKLGTMLEFVHRRARASGESVDFLTKSLVTGLGRKSAMIIDNLGISTSQLNAQLKLTPDFTEAVAAIMERDMKASGEYIETAADITERWSAEWENSKAQVGLFINKGIKLIAPVIDDLRKNMTAFFKDSSRELLEFINGWITLYNESLAFKGLVVGIKTAFKIIWTSFKTTIKLMVENLKGFGKLLKFVFNPDNWGKDFGKGLGKIISESFSAAKNDAKEGGNAIAKTFNDGVSEINKGKKSLLSWEGMFNTDVEAEEAKNSGEKVGESFADGVKKKVKEVLGTFSLPAPRIEPFEADTASAKEAVDGIKEAALDLSFVNNFLANSFSQLGENIGNSLSGVGNIFDGFLNIIIDFASQFGKILVALGVATITLKSLGINPVAAVIAGTAIIALSKLAKNMLAKGPSFAHGGIVPGNSLTGDRIPANLNSREMVLNLPQQRNLFNMARSGRGGGLGKNSRLVAQVAGTDLLFIIEEAKRMNNNSY